MPTTEKEPDPTRSGDAARVLTVLPDFPCVERAKNPGSGADELP